MTRRVVLVLVCAAACGDSGDDVVDNWRGGPWALDGSFVDQVQVGDYDRWIVTDSPALTVQHIGNGTSNVLPSVEVGGAPAGIWASAVDDVWVAGPGLWRYDGLWSEVDLGGPTALLDVWGTAPDDVWVLTEDEVVLRFDGTSWSEDTPGGSSLQEGCANAPDDVWMRGAGVFHFDGATWTEVDAAEGVSDLACDGQDVWLIGNEPGGDAFVHLRLGDRWQPLCVSDDGSLELHHAWVPAGHDPVYIVGQAMDRVEVWACFQGQLYPYIDGTLPGDPDVIFRGIWSDTFEVTIYGPDRLVYGYLWDLE